MRARKRNWKSIRRTKKTKLIANLKTELELETETMKLAKLYEFTLTFSLRDSDDLGETYTDALFEAGCDDATVGTGTPGRIALSFTREANNAEEALKSAVNDVQKAIPHAKLLEAAPDLVNLSAITEYVKFTKQNLQKYATGKNKTVKEPFAPPIVTGPTTFYRLAEVLLWLSLHTDVEFDDSILPLSKATAELNIAVQAKRLKQISVH